MLIKIFVLKQMWALLESGCWHKMRYMYHQKCWLLGKYLDIHVSSYKTQLRAAVFGYTSVTGDGGGELFKLLK